MNDELLENIFITNNYFHSCADVGFIWQHNILIYYVLYIKVYYKKKYISNNKIITYTIQNKFFLKSYYPRFIF